MIFKYLNVTNKNTHKISKKNESFFFLRIVSSWFYDESYFIL